MDQQTRGFCCWISVHLLHLCIYVKVFSRSPFPWRFRSFFFFSFSFALMENKTKRHQNKQRYSIAQ